MSIEQANHSFFPPVFEEKVIHEFPNRCFFGLGNELFVLPLIAERRRSTEWMAELRADWDRSLKPGVLGVQEMVQ